MNSVHEAVNAARVNVENEKPYTVGGEANLSRVKLIIVGGFLGAGKTTAILGIAKHYMRFGLKVGIVTNDQGGGLVDLEYLRANGLETLAVEGGCFCCNFDEFTQKVAEFKRIGGADVVLAEPVGSCTDLVATIFKPLNVDRARSLGSFSKSFKLAPLSVVVDPKRVKRLMMQEAGGDRERAVDIPRAGGAIGDAGKNDGLEAFPTEVNYLFDRQLREAAIIAVNKCDLLSQAEAGEIIAFMREKYQGADVLPISAKTGDGLADWIGRFSDAGFAPGAPMDVDYGAYAKAEASLGWLNMTCGLASEVARDFNKMAAEYMEAVREKLRAANAEIAHLKCFCVARGGHFKASVTGLHEPLDIDAESPAPQDAANLYVNARANIAPPALKEICESALDMAFAGVSLSGVATECFAPAPPRPTHRIP